MKGAGKPPGRPGPGFERSDSVSRVPAGVREAGARRVTWIGLIWNLAMTAFKLFAGILGGSGAMVADGFHSASDLATDMVVLTGIRISSRPVDETHRYGHGKFETLATTAIGAALLVTGAGILRSGVLNILHGARGAELTAPGGIALFAAAASILVKEGLYRYTSRAGRLLESGVLRANAWHHRTDAFSSVAALLGIGGAIVLGEGWRILDPAAAVIVSLFILRAGVGILSGSLGELIESSLGGGVDEEISVITRSVPGASDPHDIRTRRIGRDIALDLHVRVDGGMSVRDAHAIATRIEELIRERFGASSFISVHIEPDPPEGHTASAP